MFMFEEVPGLGPSWASCHRRSSTLLRLEEASSPSEGANLSCPFRGKFPRLSIKRERWAEAAVHSGSADCF